MKESFPAPPKYLLEPFSIGSVPLPSRFNLAPLAGYTHMPFRLTVRELGGLGLATTDLVSARAILENSRKTFELLATCPEDKPLAVQIYGSNLKDLDAAAKFLEARGTQIIDINMGCPVNKVVKGGGGSAMMCDTTGQTLKVVQTVVEAVKIPVTVKMRLGWDDTQLTAPKFAAEFEQIGVSAITIHGRTREQGFSGSVNRDGIRTVVEAVQKIPVIGNGDIRNIEEAHRMIDETGCAAIAIGRGGLANPWIFRQLNNWLHTGVPGGRGSFEERIEFMETHLRRMIDWRGEHLACLQFRKVSAYHCRAIKADKDTHMKLQMLSRWSDFQEVVLELREKGPPKNWQAGGYEAEMNIPSGAISHW
ncbi:tRNA dihydrouridine synthase DusB [Telmatocola sphagniphila]|uniref:tRNA-dihydrouridine synthase n=1 Tax=Telmatocola sphagniphila TaxID=1123043 RepID=A0A8E6BA03_9BACT|nr:tRNA dihydrouridine synthase DusB [Telmatocola sphagniphila]QVL34543.1 tRNA dihydrouridine synthase DusB [Telmatocola sphagniphila]